MKKAPEYAFAIRPLSKADGGGFMIAYPDLPGCISDGDTLEETIQNGQEAVREWLHANQLLKRKVPNVKATGIPHSYSGKVLQRFPKTLHARLAARAKQEGVSLNQLILSLVSEGMGTRA